MCYVVCTRFTVHTQTYHTNLSSPPSSSYAYPQSNTRDGGQISNFMTTVGFSCCPIAPSYFELQERRKFSHRRQIIQKVGRVFQCNKPYFMIDYLLPHDHFLSCQ